MGRLYDRNIWADLMTNTILMVCKKRLLIVRQCFVFFFTVGMSKEDRSVLEM